MTSNAALCPTLANTLTFESFGAVRRGRALGEPLNLRLLPGTVLGVVGPNGVGKSSLLAALAQTGVHSYGRVRRGDVDLRRVRAQERAAIISLLAQDYNAPDELRVHELVAIGAHASRRPHVQDATDEALDAVGISDLESVRFGSLSGGQKQLVQIARVLAQNTPIVILDEPTSALDLFYQRTVEQIMRRLGNDGKIVITALHDLSLALNTCTQALLLGRNGEVTAGPPVEVLGRDLVHDAYGVHTTIHTTEHGRRFLSTH